MGFLDGLTRHQVGRNERAGERRNRLHSAADHYRLAVGHAAFEAPGVVRAPQPVPNLISTLDHVLDGRTEQTGLLEPEAELNTLDDRDAHDRSGQRRVQTTIPMDMAAEPDRDAAGDHLEDAAHGVAGVARLVDAGDHSQLGIGIGAAERAGFRLIPAPRGMGRIEGHAAYFGGVRPNADPELGQKLPCNGPGGYPSGRLASRRALEDVPDVVEAVLGGAGQVRMTGSQSRDRSGLLVARCRQFG